MRPSGGNDGYDDLRDRLVARYSDTDDTIGRLWVRAASEGFSGEASAWFDTEALVRFANDLAQYPLPAGSPIEVASGFGELGSQGLSQEHVRMRVQPVGIKGQIGVHVHLRTPEWPDTPPESVNDVWLHLLTTYERLGRFSGHLLAVLTERLDEAVLGRERMI